MRRGTTPTLIFQFDAAELDLSSMTQIWVTIFDGRGVERTWDITRVTIDNENKQISLLLSQEETLSFATGIAQAQIRMLTSDGTAIATSYSNVTINNILKEGIIE